MATKPDRYKKLPPLKVRKRETPGSRGARPAKLTDAEIAEGTAASEKIAKRPTKDFSREELGALMQTAPGATEPHQIKTQSRQFRRVSDDLPEAIVADKRVSPSEDLRHKKPMSAKTPKIDPED
jgi:hypothetical protein